MHVLEIGRGYPDVLLGAQDRVLDDVPMKSEAGEQFDVSGKGHGNSYIQI